MTIKVKTTTESTINLETPVYYKGLYTGYYFITDEKMIRVMDSVISVWTPGEKYFDDSVIEAMRNETCTKEEFETALVTFLDKVGECIPEHHTL